MFEDREELERAVKNASSKKEAMKSLGVEPEPRTYKPFNEAIEKFDIDTPSSFKTMSKKTGHNKTPKELEPILDKHDLSYSDLVKQCHASDELKNKRSGVITELHSSGMTWDRMSDLIGKSTGFIQKYTQAVGNEESHKNRVENARKVGHSRRGEKKPWLSDQMEEAWEDGDFDFHIGRDRPEEEIQKIRESWTEEMRSEASKRMKRNWGDKEYRQELLKFHRSKEERRRRSKQQALKMKEEPETFFRSEPYYEDVGKCANPNKGDKVSLKSSYEVATKRLLDDNNGVISYLYEPTFHVKDSWILPDFLVSYRDTSRPLHLIEVKAAWDSKNERLQLAENMCHECGWDFSIWTEEDKLNGLV